MAVLPDLTNALAITRSKIDSNPNSPLTQAVTVQAGANLLTVAIGHDSAGNGTNLTGITFNGLPLIWLSDTPNAPNLQSSIFYLASPPVGTFNLVISFTQPYNAVLAAVVSWSGVDLVNGPFGAIANATGNSAFPGVSNASALTNADVAMGWAFAPSGNIFDTGSNHQNALAFNFGVNTATSGFAGFDRLTCEYIPGPYPATFTWQMQSVVHPWVASAIIILGTGAALAGTAADYTGSAGALSALIKLQGLATDAELASGALQTAIRIVASAMDTTAATGALTTVPVPPGSMVGRAQSVSTASGALTTHPAPPYPTVHTGGAYSSLITSEHNQKLNFMLLIGVLTDAIADARNVAASLSATYDLDLAVGVQLDAVGAWVGQPRLIPLVLVQGFFGFLDDAVALQFGELSNQSIGGRFYELGENYAGTSLLSDNDYRLILRARIVRNQAHETLSDLERALQFIFQAVAHVTDTGNLSIAVVVSVPITPTVRSILTTLDLLPRPAGISVSSITFAT